MLHQRVARVKISAAAQAQQRNNQRQALLRSILANRAGHDDGEVALLAAVTSASTQLRMGEFMRALRTQPARRDLAQRLIVNLRRRVDAAREDQALIDLLQMATGQRAVANCQAFGRPRRCRCRPRRCCRRTTCSPPTTN